MLEFVDSDLYFVQDKNNFINPLLQVGSGSVEKSTGSGSGGQKSTGSGSGGQKITGSDRIRIRILIPAKKCKLSPTNYQQKEHIDQRKKVKSHLKIFVWDRCIFALAPGCRATVSNRMVASSNSEQEYRSQI